MNATKIWLGKSRIILCTFETEKKKDFISKKRRKSSGFGQNLILSKNLKF